MDIKTGTIIALALTGYGYISQDSKKDTLFFHAKDVANGRFDYLRIGEKVEYVEVRTAKGRSAKNIILARRKDKFIKIKYI
jgi:cold shock CspA family protein